jgi:hypothetical protein
MQVVSMWLARIDIITGQSITSEQMDISGKKYDTKFGTQVPAWQD